MVTTNSTKLKDKCLNPFFELICTIIWYRHCHLFVDAKTVSHTKTQGNTVNKLHSFYCLYQESLLPVTLIALVFQRNITPIRNQESWRCNSVEVQRAKNQEHQCPRLEWMDVLAQTENTFALPLPFGFLQALNGVHQCLLTRWKWSSSSSLTQMLSLPETLAQTYPRIMLYQISGYPTAQPCSHIKLTIMCVLWEQIFKDALRSFS